MLFILQIAMKTHNVQMLRLIENILRKYKPTTHGSFEGSRMSSSDQPEQAFYENVSTNKSNQSAASSSEVMIEYRFFCLPCPLDLVPAAAFVWLIYFMIFLLFHTLVV